MTFDVEDRLTAHSAVLAAAYRGDNLRAWKQISAGRTYFLYDGTMPILELDSSGTIVATNTFTSGKLVSRRVTSVSVLYMFDSEGNVAQRTDSGANVLSNHFFNAHGGSLNNPSSDPFGYKAQSGYYSDHETGLQLLTNRYYDPSSGRFLTRVPIGYAGGINLYSYVTNNPTNYADPSGLNPGVLALPVLGGGGAAAAAALPPVAIAAGYAVILYGAWNFGEWLAAQPWNPLTHPSFPAAPPFCPTIPMRSKEPWSPSYPIPGYPPRVPPLGPIKPSDPEKEDECFKECAPLMWLDRSGNLYRKCYRECRGSL